MIIHVLDVADWSPELAHRLVAATLRDAANRGHAAAGIVADQAIRQSGLGRIALSLGDEDLRDVVVANVFSEPSTRTRAAFEIATTSLGGTVINLDLLQSSVRKGESVADSLANLAAMGIGVFVVRDGENGSMARLASGLDNLADRAALVSAGEGTRSHPSQALLDAATMWAMTGRPIGDLSVVIVGDIHHSRVAAANLSLLQKLGVRHLRIAGPAALLPPDSEFPAADRARSLPEALAGADVVMTLRLQRERLADHDDLDPDEYARNWQLTSAQLAEFAPGAVVMHPGPLNRGVEIESALADGPRSAILEQVRIGVSARRVLLAFAAGALAAWTDGLVEETSFSGR